MRVIATLGVSASGKSTWARSHVAAMAGLGQRWRSLCNDDIRLDLLRARGVPESELEPALLRWVYSDANPDEALVASILAERIGQAQLDGLDGIVLANTNLDGGVGARAALAAAGAGDLAVETRRLPISMELALSRDAARAFQVGPQIIAWQFEKLAALGDADL